MPEYVYRAVNKQGLIVKNKVEEASKQTLIKTLKENGLMPIQIVQIAYIGRKNKRCKENKEECYQHGRHHEDSQFNKHI